jgi:hypothetical protein
MATMNISLPDSIKMFIEIGMVAAPALHDGKDATWNSPSRPARQLPPFGAGS